MTRCPFSLSRLVKVAETGQVIYKAEKQSCQAFPDQNGDGIVSGPKRNFRILSPLDFLAEFTQHIPPKGAHLIRYYAIGEKKSRIQGLIRAFCLKALPSICPACPIPRSTIRLLPQMYIPFRRDVSAPGHYGATTRLSPRA